MCTSFLLFYHTVASVILGKLHTFAYSCILLYIFGYFCILPDMFACPWCIFGYLRICFACSWYIFGYFLIPSYAHIEYLFNLIWLFFLFNLIPWAAENEREWSYVKSGILVVSACNWIWTLLRCNLKCDHLSSNHVHTYMHVHFFLPHANSKPTAAHTHTLIPGSTHTSAPREPTQQPLLVHVNTLAAATCTCTSFCVSLRHFV